MEKNKTKQTLKPWRKRS